MKGGKQVRTWLIERRKKHFLTQSEVARAAKISQASYCNIERGKINPKPKTAKRIANVLQFDWTEFFEEHA